jgi:class 3 adenylate cyclase
MNRTAETAAAPSIVLFADLVGSTSLYRTLGDLRAAEVVRAGLDRSRTTVARHSGRVLKSLGDGLLCVFVDASSAAGAAVDLQRETREPLTEDGAKVQLRIGFYAGPVLEREGDIFGDAVNVAARLCSMAKPESILTSDHTSKLLSRELQSTMRIYDHTPVKGIDEALTIVQLVWDKRSATEIFSITSAGPAIVAFALTLTYQSRDLKLTPAALPIVIGREPDCDLVVAAPFASRHHARIEYRRGKFMLVDQSTNGSYVSTKLDAPAVYVRDESFPLLGEGILSLGARIEQQTEHVLRYAAC